MRIPSQVLQFAGEANVSVYKMFADYFNHYRSLNGETGVDYQTSIVTPEGATKTVSFSEKESQMNAALQREIVRVAGVQDLSQFPLETWANHPMLKWASFAVVSAMIDMVLPDAIIKNIGAYSEVRSIGWGDSASFDVEPRDIFVVSKVGKSKRTTELHKQFRGQVTVLPELRALTVMVSLMKVLAGKESLAELVTKMVRSFETALALDVYTAFATAMGNLSNTASTGLRVAGYTQAEFVRLSQTVSAWNGGTGRPIALGTQAALANIMPSDANYRYDLESDFVKLGYIRNFLGTDLIMLPQIADWETPFGTKLYDDRIWIISPSSQKLIKVVLEGSTLSYTSDVYANANLIQTHTMMKSWGMALATNAIAAQISL